MSARIHVDEQKLADVCTRNRIRRLSFFGSVLRDDFGPQSDIDVLVEFDPDATPGFIRLYCIEQELSAILGGRRLDLLSPKALHPLLREKVLREAELQYAA
jgi:predicted nucleotidyltransferase